MNNRPSFAKIKETGEIVNVKTYLANGILYLGEYGIKLAYFDEFDWVY